jgi:hypothetical protein
VTTAAIAVEFVGAARARSRPARPVVCGGILASTYKIRAAPAPIDKAALLSNHPLFRELGRRSMNASPPMRRHGMPRAAKPSS